MFRRLGLIAGLIITVSFLGYILLDSQDYRLVFEKQYQLAVVSSPTFVCPVLTGPLAIGGKGLQVRYLQQILARYFSLPDGYFPSGQYDELTTAFVKRYQRENNIVSTGDPSTTGYGLAGVITRKHLRDWCVRTFGVSDLPVFGAVADQIRQIQLKLIALLRQLIALLLSGREPPPSPPPPPPPPPPPLCNPGEVRECGTDVGVCQKGNQTCQENGYWSECKNEIKPQEEICSDELDNDCDGQTNEGCEVGGEEPSFILSYYGRFIDAGSIWYEQYLPTYIQLQNLGFTHAGIHIWRQSSDISEQIQSLRDRGIPIMLHAQTGHYFLLPGTNQPGGDGEEMLDPEEHASNGQNLKYYDFLNFNASECNPVCGSCPSYRALDPSYNGVVWQKEISYLKNAVRQAELGPGDIVAMDNELWSVNPTKVEVCYPGAFLQDSEIYHGSTLDERYEEYYNYWLQRGIDMKNAVKEINPQIGVYHHHENTYKLARGMFYGDTNWYLASTGMPYGSGDAPSPEFYRCSNLTTCRKVLDQDDFSGAVVWISFSFSYHDQQYPKYPWDPKITQKVGYWLRQEGVKGIIEYPGPYGHNIPIEYYMAHAQALLKGFLENEDPGEI